MDLVCCVSRGRAPSQQPSQQPLHSCHEQNGGMDLFCCTERVRASSYRQKNGCTEHHSLGSRGNFFLEQRVDLEDAPESGHPPPENDVCPQSTASLDQNKSNDSHKDNNYPNGDHGGIPIPLGLSERTGRRSSLNSSLDAVHDYRLPPESELVSEERFKQLATQIRRQVRQLPRPSRTYASLLPEDSARQLTLELRPGHGTGLEQWINSELAISDLDRQPLSLNAIATPREPLVAVRLTRISKAKRIEKHDGGRSMRVRFKQPDRRDVFEEILEHSSPDDAQACTEALVECIEWARALQGYRAHDF